MTITAFVLVLARATPAALLPFLLTLLLVLGSALLEKFGSACFFLMAESLLASPFWGAFFPLVSHASCTDLSMLENDNFSC